MKALKQEVKYTRGVLALHKNEQYFTNNKLRFLKDFHGKHVILKDEKIAGVFSFKFEAEETAAKKFEKGTYVIKSCLPGC